MSRTLRRFMPIAALCLATLLGGCVVVPEGGYRNGWYGRDWHEGGREGWRGGWHR